MEHDLELIIARLEILEIEVCNILHNPGNIGNWSFLIQSYPGNPPAPACQGPSGCEGRGLKSAVNVILSFIDISYFKYSSNIPSAITIWWSTGQQTGVWQSRGQQAGDIDLLLDALVHQFTFHQPSSLSLGCLWWDPENQWNFNAYPIHQKITKMVSQDLPKSPKWGPKSYPKSSKWWKNLKKWNLMKTSISTVLWKG